MRRIPLIFLTSACVGATVLGGLYFQKRLSLGKQPDGSFLVSSNQRITPVGDVFLYEGTRPKDLAVSPDGKFVAVLGTNRLFVMSRDGKVAGNLRLSGGPLGVAWSPNGQRIYASVSDGKVQVSAWDGSNLKKEKDIDIRGENKNDPHVAGLAISPDGKRLYAAMTMRDSVAVINLENGEDAGRIAVGVAPYHILLSPDGKTLAVSNRGGARVSAPEQQNDPNTGRPFTGVGIATEVTGDSLAQVDPQTDAVWRGTISLIDTAQLTVREVTVGRQPAGLAFAADGKALYVAESDSDSISFVNVPDGRQIGNLSIRPKEDPQFGQIPTGIAPSRDGKRLFVSLGGANAVAVVDITGTPKVLGYAPTGWFPISIGAYGDHVYIASAKGIGARPASKTGGFGVHNSVGTFQAISVEAFRDLASLTKDVAKNNGWNEPQSARASRPPVPVPQRVGEPSVFKHVVYIIKENLTYDVALGDMKEGNGDPSLCLFGEKVTPNQHALSREFVLLDNFYTSGTNSADGHQWAASSIGNGYIEQNYASAVRSYPYNGGDALVNSPAGFLWNAAAKAGRTVRVFGEFVNKPKIVNPATGREPSWTEAWLDYKSGKNSMIVEAHTDNAALRPYLHPSFIGFPSIISDQWRADTFIKDLKDWEKKDDMPNLSIMLLPNNHTSGTGAGVPTPRAMVADNDLALGRMVEAISKSKFWKDTLILVVEDDSQNGVDHLDGHRCPALAISAYTKRGAVVSDLYNHTSMIRTMGLVLGIPPMSRFDRTGNPMTACFTTAPNFAPYTAKANQIPINEMNPNPKNLSRRQRALAEASAAMDFRDIDRANASTLAQAIWYSVKPTTPFPQHLYHVPTKPDGDGD